jgi:Ca2+-binding RTX toxin-like protein
MISGGGLYFTSASDYETKQTYSVTITGLSLSGKMVTKTFTIEIKNVDEQSYTSSDDVITGTDSDDYLYGGSGNDTISGGLGNDNITGGIGNDILNGNEGDDSLFGWGGDDEIHGGTGDDLIYGHEDADKLYGDEGNDTIYGWGGNDHIEGGTGDDLIIGGPGDDFIYGDLESGETNSDGNDEIIAGAGDDVVWGRSGDDLIYGSSGNDTLRGGSGDDTIKGGSGDDRVIGQTGNDTLEGGYGNDLIYGDNETGESTTDGNDVMFGGFGDDEIYGRGGDDFLVGQGGKDILTGGAGNDTFVLTSYDVTGPAQFDTIKDFVDGEDKIGLINLDFDSLIINQIGFGVDANTEITDADGYTLAILEGITSDLITADDFVSLNYDLSEVVDATASFIDLSFDSLGISGNPSEGTSITPNGEGSANPNVPMTDGQPNFNDQINNDLIDSMIDLNPYDDYSINDFI